MHCEKCPCFKKGISAQKTPTPNSEFVQDVFEQTEMILQDVRKNAMQVYIYYKGYHDKKGNASELKK